MTVSEALLQTQGKGAGFLNRRSAQYAQTLLLPDEEPVAAVLANINAKGERFPGVVVLTRGRAIAVCNLPGIRRTIVCALGDPVECTESPTAVCYKAIFSDEKSAFSFTIDPDVGEKFSRCIAVLNGEVEAFDAAGAVNSTGILNPSVIRNRHRARQAKERKRVTRAVAQERAKERRQQRIRDADADTKAIAERLAAELAEKEEQSK